MIESVYSLIDSILCILFISACLGIEKKKKKLIIPAILVLFAVTLVCDYFLAGFSILSTTILFIVSLIYAFMVCGKKIIKAIIVCCIYKATIILTSSLLYIVISNLISDFQTLMMGSDSTIRIVYVLLHKVIIFSIFYFIASIFRDSELNNIVTGCIVFFISALTVVGLGFVLNTLADGNIAAGITLVSVFVIINVGMYVLVNQVRKLEKQKYDLKFLNDRYTFQQEKYLEAAGVWKNVRKVQHDIKNHLTIIQSQLDKGEIDACKKYVGELIPSTGQIGKVITSENTILDYLINSKLCNLKDTKVIVSGSVGDLSDIPESEFVSIFGNILDNAIEAIDGLEEKRIELLFSKHNSNRIIICKNTIGKSVLEENGNLDTTKKDKEMHGLGHVIVEEAVKKLGGMIDYSETGDMFAVQIILPLIQPKEK